MTDRQPARPVMLPVAAVLGAAMLGVVVLLGGVCLPQSAGPTPTRLLREPAPEPPPPLNTTPAHPSPDDSGITPDNTNVRRGTAEKAPAGTFSPGATPPPPPGPVETRAEANRRVIDSIGPDRKIELGKGVFAIANYGLPHDPWERVLIYDYATDSQLFIDTQGTEVHRSITDADAKDRLEAILQDEDTISRALSLLR